MLKIVDPEKYLFSYNIPYMGDDYCSIWPGTSPSGAPQIAFGTHQNGGLHAGSVMEHLAPMARSLLLPNEKSAVEVIVNSP